MEKGKRTKTKASSSSEAASLLATQGFVGFDSVYGGESGNAFLPNDYQLAFKKLSKKDTVTKLKGFAELKVLFPTIAEEIKPAILENWVQAFNRSGMDNDRQVREAVHETFLILIQQVKKDLATVLKRIIGVWLCNQFDPFREVRSAAQNSFKSAIPRKQSEALVFCKNELLEQLQENLRQTAQTLSDVKSVSDAEVQERYERFISCSLLALDFTIDQLPPAENEKLMERYASLLDDAFWKLLSSKSVAIRKAAYQLANTAILRLPALVTSRLKALTAVVTNVLSDREPVTHSAMWGLLLSFFQKYPNAWAELNLRKQFLPKLFSFFRAGAYGSGGSSYPSVLPLLNLLVTNANALEGEPTAFYKEFFSNLWAGLKPEGGIASDSGALVAAYMECVMYAVITHVKKSQVEIATYVLSGPFFETFTEFLSAEKPHFALGPYTKAAAEVLYKLVARGDAFEPLLGSFWRAIEEIAAVHLLSADTDAASFALFSTRLGSFLENIQSTHQNALAQQKPAPSPPAGSLTSSSSGVATPSVTVASDSPFVVSMSTSKFLKALFSNSLTSARKKGHLDQLKLCSRIATICGTKNVLAVPLREFLQHDVIPWIAELSTAASVPEELLGALFELARASLLELRSDEATENWNTLLKAILATKNRSIHALLIQKVCAAGDGGSRWAVTALDAYALECTSSLVHSLPGSAERLAQKNVLSILVSAKNPLLSPDTFVSLLQKLNAALSSESKALNENASRPLNNTNLRQVVDLLDVVSAYISSSHFTTPSDLNAAKIDLLQQVLLLRVSFVAQKEEKEEEGDSAPSRSYAVALAAKKAWERVSASAKELLSKSNLANQFLSTTCQQLVQKLIAPTASGAHFSMDVFVETVRDLDEFAVSLRGSSAEGRRLVLDHLAVPRAEWLRIRNRAFTELVSRVDTLHRSSHIRFVVPMSPITNDDVIGQWTRLVQFTVRLVRDFGLSISELHNETATSTSSSPIPNFWILSELLLAKDLSSDSAVHAEMRSFAPTLTEGALLSQNSIQALLKKEEEQNNSSWKNYLTLLATESIQHGGFDAYALALVLKEKFSAGTAEHLLDLLTAEGRVSENGFADTLHVVLPYLRNNGANFSSKLDPLKNKIISAFLEITPEVISNSGSLQRVINTIESLNAFLHSFPDQKEESRRLQSFLLQIQSWFFKSPPAALWRDLSSNSDLHSAMAQLLSEVVVRTAKSGEEFLATQIEFLISFTLDLIKVSPLASKSSAALLASQYRRLSHSLRLASSLLFYPAQLKSQFFDRIAKLRQQISEILCDQLCSRAASGASILLWSGSALTLYSQVAAWLLADTHFTPDKSRLDSLYPLLLVPHFEVQKAAYVMITHAQPKGEEGAAPASPSPAKGAALDNSGVSEQLDEKAMQVELQSNSNSLPKPLTALASRDILQPHYAAAVIFNKAAGTVDAELHLHEVYGYLLAWNVLLDLLVYSPKQRSRMSAHLRHNEMFSRFLVSLFQYLTPPEDEKYRPDALKIEDVKPTRESLSLFAYYLYFRSVKYLPALVRIWWTDDCERNSAILVERFTTRYLSPALVDSEFKQVSDYENKADNFSLKASKAANEVQAVYEKDELKLGITCAVTVKVPPSYPLRSVELDCVKRVGAPESMWRKWLLSMTTLLLTQDASILDAILLWKQSLDSHFEGVECCPICYCVFHASNHSLPKLACKTCKNKFHHACMYKWFQTSHKSNCPLCQTPFSFEKHL